MIDLEGPGSRYWRVPRQGSGPLWKHIHTHMYGREWNSAWGPCLNWRWAWCWLCLLLKFDMQSDVLEGQPVRISTFDSKFWHLSLSAPVQANQPESIAFRFDTCMLSLVES